MLVTCSACGQQMEFLNLAEATTTTCLHCGAEISVGSSDSSGTKKMEQKETSEATKELHKLLDAMAFRTGRYSQKNHFNKLKECIENGADVDSYKTGFGQTLLHFAVVNGYVDLAELCLKHGADVETTDAETNTPLHSVALSDVKRCSGNRRPLAALLLGHGADLGTKNRSGETPKDVALRKHRKYTLQDLFFGEKSIIFGEKSKLEARLDMGCSIVVGLVMLAIACGLVYGAYYFFCR